MKFLLSLVVLASLAVAGVSAQATCKLSGLALSGLDIHDSNGNGFSPTVYNYYCNCGANQATTVLTLTSPDTNTAYAFTYTKANSAPDQTVYLTKPSGSSTYTSSTVTLAAGTNQFAVQASCNSCTNTYVIKCVKDTPPPSGGLVIGDPQFTGLRGQSYQVHGVSGEVYSIISDKHLQMNSKFVFLNHGECPVVEGKVNKKGCWSHPGSYLGEIGIKTASGDQIKIVSGAAKKGFALVTLNGKPMKNQQINDLPCPDGDAPGFVSFNNTHVVTVQAGNFLLEFENSDLFINQRVRVLDWTTLQSHGLLGQTWRSKTYNNAVKHIEGNVDDYVVGGKDLFGDKFTFNQFESKATSSESKATSSESKATSSESKSVSSKLKSRSRPVKLQE